MTSVAVIVDNLYDSRVFEDLSPVFFNCLPFLKDFNDILDIIILQSFQSVDNLDSVLGKLYSICREVLLTDNKYDVQINVLFNLSIEHYQSFHWNAIFITKDLNKDVFPHTNVFNYQLSSNETKCIRLGTFDEERYSVSALGGTFDHIHDGHKVLLSVASFLTRTKLVIGITDQELLQHKKYAEVLQTFEKRCSNVRDFLQRLKPTLELDMIAIRDVCGPTGRIPEIEALIISRETVSGGELVNKTREENGMRHLAIHVVNVLGGRKEDGWKEKLSSTGIRYQCIKQNKLLSIKK